MVEIKVNSWGELDKVICRVVSEPTSLFVANELIGILVPPQSSNKEGINSSHISPLKTAVNLLIKETKNCYEAENIASLNEDKFSHFFNYSPAPTRIENWHYAKSFLKAELVRRKNNDCEALLLSNPHIISECLSRVVVVDFNPSFLCLIDSSQDTAPAQKVDSLLAPSSTLSIAKLLTEIVESNDVVSGQVKVRKLDGGERYIQIQFLPVQDVDSQNEKVIVTYTDITEHKRLNEIISAAESHPESNRKVKFALDNINQGVITTDRQGRVTQLNVVAQKLLHCDSSVSGQPIEDIFSPFNTSFDNIQLLYDACLISKSAVECDSHSLVEIKEGIELWVTYSVSPVLKNGEIVEFVVIFHDVSESQSLLERLRLQTSKDALTNLYNRQEFEKQIKISLDSAKRKGHGHSFLLVDLDQFKVINESCGHHAGDELLRQLARLLESKVRTYDVVARMGGDEFAIMLKNCNEVGANSIAESILESIREFRFVWDGKIFSLTASIGIVLISSAIKHVQTVLSYADFAVHAAKDGGKNRIQLYDKNQKNLAHQHEQLEWVTKINYALEHDLLVLSSQKICPISTAAGTQTHFEMLVRMLGQDGKIIPPGAFLPAAERYNLMPQIDRWVIKSAFRWLAANAGKRSVYTGLCSINLSGHSISDETFFQFVDEQFQRTKIPGNLICFEITESMAIYNLAQTLEFIHKFKAFGCKFALDDFGSGFSSYGYLKSLPVDFLKIDGSFVRQMINDPVDLAMVKSINEVGHVMNTMTIAEFVENDETLHKLKEIGVDFAQGYGIGEPELLTSMNVGQSKFG
ncbi:hypothetical protein A9Q99_26465 [Gammaproteobacteria bacterium 45_16_T64]|nr:hypothetical protein A9Q99_26465 [Gammaproteobacteria bacterium 45_16_T64]